MPDTGFTGLRSDWVKVITLLGGLVVTLFTIGRWWGETQTELHEISSAVTRLDVNIAEFARRANAVERQVDEHEYRLRSLERNHTGAPLPQASPHDERH